MAWDPGGRETDTNNRASFAEARWSSARGVLNVNGGVTSAARSLSQDNQVGCQYVGTGFSQKSAPTHHRTNGKLSLYLDISLLFVTGNI